MFWENFSSICSNRGITPTSVVLALNLSRGSVTHWKNGKLPHADTIRAIAEYLGVTPDDLLKSGADQAPFSGAAEQESAFTVSAEEYRLILAWRTCPDAVRPAILQLLGVPDKAEARDVVS